MFTNVLETAVRMHTCLLLEMNHEDFKINIQEALNAYNQKYFLTHLAVAAIQTANRRVIAYIFENFEIETFDVNSELPRLEQLYWEDAYQCLEVNLPWLFSELFNPEKYFIYIYPSQFESANFKWYQMYVDYEAPATSYIVKYPVSAFMSILENHPKYKLQKRSENFYYVTIRTPSEQSDPKEEEPIQEKFIHMFMDLLQPGGVENTTASKLICKLGDILKAQTKS